MYVPILPYRKSLGRRRYSGMKMKYMKAGEIYYFRDVKILCLSVLRKQYLLYISWLYLNGPSKGKIWKKDYVLEDIIGYEKDSLTC